MGCDIHMFAEIKLNRKSGQYEWKTVGRVFKDNYHTKNEPTYMSLAKGEKSDSAYEWNSKLTMEPYGARNYDVFAMLADVRNGRGFAGCDTGDGFNPIADPKGVPEDASDYYKQVVEEWDGDGHSHSYFSMEELDAYDWNQKTKHRGWVGIEEYKVFKEQGHPNSWSGGVDGGAVKHITNKEMDEVIAGIFVIEGMPYTQVEWESSYLDSAKWFLEAMKDVKKLKKLKGVEDVRIVFFFDN